MSLWLALIAAGLLTYALRLSFIAGWGRLRMPRLLERALRFVPVAVLVALITPDVLQPGGHLDLSLANDRLLATLVAVLVAARSRNMLFTIAAGMGTLLLLHALR